MRRHRSAGFLIVAALVVTGCGSSKGGTTGAQSTTTLTPVGPTTTAPVVTDPAKSAKAKAAILQQSDFPAGWTTQPEDSGLGLETIWGDITKCLGVQETAPPAGMATSPTFLRGLATQARSTVEYTSETAATSIATALGDAKYEMCALDALTADVKRSAPTGGVPGQVQMAALQAPQGLQAVQKTFSNRFTVTIDMQDLKVPITQDLIVAFNGGTIVRMVYLNPGSPFPQDLEQTLTQKVVGRA